MTQKEIFAAGPQEGGQEELFVSKCETGQAAS